MNSYPSSSENLDDTRDAINTMKAMPSSNGDALEFSDYASVKNTLRNYLEYYNTFNSYIEIIDNSNSFINTYDSIGSGQNNYSSVAFVTADNPVLEIKFDEGRNGFGYYHGNVNSEYSTYMGADTSDAITNTLLTMFLDEEQMYAEWWPEHGVNLKEIHIEGAAIELDGKTIQEDILKNFGITSALKNTINVISEELEQKVTYSNNLEIELENTYEDLVGAEELSEKLGEKLQSTSDALARTEQELKGLDVQLLETTKELINTEKEAFELNKTLEKTNEQLEKSFAENEELENDLQSLEGDYTALENKAEELTYATKDLEDKNIYLSMELDLTRNDLRKEMDRNNMLLEDIAYYSSQVKELEGENINLSIDLDHTNMRLMEEKHINYKLIDENSHLYNETQILLENNKRLEDEKMHLHIDLDHTNMRLMEEVHFNNKLREENSYFADKIDKLGVQNSQLSLDLDDTNLKLKSEKHENNKLSDAVDYLEGELRFLDDQLKATESLVSREPQAKDYKAKLPNGKDLVIESGEVLSGLSFGEKYTELVVDKYPYYDFDKDDFTINKVSIGSGDKISAQEAGITVDEKGLWTIDTRLAAYENLPTTGRRVTDVTVDFTVTDPLDRTDKGTVTFGVVNNKPVNNDENLILETTITRAGNVEQLKGWELAEGYLLSDIVNDWKFGVTENEDILENSSDSQIFAAANSYAKDSDNYYVVDVTANAINDYNINSIDINFTFDSSKFEWVGTNIDDSFDIFNTTSKPTDSNSINDLSTLRVVGGSAQQLTGGAAGIGRDIEREIMFPDDTSAFKVLLKAIHDKSTRGEEENIEFKTSLNSTDTILTSMSNVENIINGVAETHIGDYSFSSSHVAFEAKNDIKFATKRSIGVMNDLGEYTSLVREGETLESLGTISFKNKGNIQSDFKAVITNDSNDPHDEVKFSTFDINFAEEDRTKMVTGNVNHSNAKKDYKLELYVEGSAGEVIDLEGVSVQVTNEAQDDLQSTDLNGKNLITYKSDINYDGRVSMSDLAYLNAGAARKTYSEDVDVNMDDKITMDDLAVMDKEWGNSLHINKPLINGDMFTGTNKSTIDLSYEVIGDDAVIDNSAFINQNKLEQMDDFEGSLAVAGSQGYTDPWEGQNNYDEVEVDYSDMR